MKKCSFVGRIDPTFLGKRYVTGVKLKFIIEPDDFQLISIYYIEKKDVIDLQWFGLVKRERESGMEWSVKVGGWWKFQESTESASVRQLRLATGLIITHMNIKEIG